MTALSGPRSLRLRLLIAYIGPVLFALHGCESSSEQRLAVAREMVKRQQAEHAAATSALTPSGGAAVPPGSNGSQPVEAVTAADLPIYPGARKISTGSGSETGLDDGLSMAMLETHDSVDAVIGFYSKHMISSDDRLNVTRADDRLDGHRVARLSLPQPDGGLQTVEAREEPGKTTIQLLNMKGKTSREIPRTIPGVDPLAPASSRSGSGASSGHLTTPSDLSNPGQPTNGPLLPRLSGR